MAGIYLHIPFCKQACYYCNFHFSTSLKHKEPVVQAILRELEIRYNYLNQQQIESIYFGGGTPSLLSNSELALILDKIEELFSVNANVEITLEANPDDLSEERLRSLVNSRINRLSIGIQSFFDEDLKYMNRAHSAREAEHCLALATRLFDNITIDLIYGVPNMSNERWRLNVLKALSYNVSHISSYALTVEEKTALDLLIKKGKLEAVNEELAASHFSVLLEETAKAGLVHYEISNFGKEGYFSKHNTSYWQGKSYLGVGPSAHSFNGKERSWNIANNTKYIKALRQNELPLEIEKLTVEDRFNEAVMIGLRTLWGVDLNSLKKEFGDSRYFKFQRSYQPFVEKGLLEVSEINCLKATAQGQFLIDGIASDLFIV